MGLIWRHVLSRNEDKDFVNLGLHIKIEMEVLQQYVSYGGGGTGVTGMCILNCIYSMWDF